MTRYNKTEKAAIAACDRIKNEGSLNFRIEWVCSATWGSNPNVKANGETVGRASGWGYDKESAALYAFLRFLEPDVKPFDGVGFDAAVRNMAAMGWKLEKTYSGKTEDGYHISRIS
jgi:hypothetical protein